MNRNNRLIPILQFVKENILFDSSDEDEIIEKISYYAEETVPNLPDRQFQMNFRMSPETFEDLLSNINSVLPERSVGYPRTSLEKELMITVWYLGNIESFRSVAERFGISKSTCWEILNRTSKLLLKINKRYGIISWPTRERQIEISQTCMNNSGFPGIIGFIDGSHIRCTAPRQYTNSYVNRKGYHSILLQGICDHELLFTDVYAGEVGSMHDFTMFKKSDVFRAISNGRILFYNDSHILGDLAYKLSPTLLVGFKNNRVLSEREKNFNITLAKQRVKIENAFSLLKGRFRRLKFLETVRLDLIPLFIVCGCILHNICIRKGDAMENFINIEEELHEEQNNNPNNLIDINDELEINDAIRKRNFIVNSLPNLRENL